MQFDSYEITSRKSTKYKGNNNKYQRLLQQRFRTERLPLLHVGRDFRVPVGQNARRAGTMSYAGALGDTSGRLAGLSTKHHFYTKISHSVPTEFTQNAIVFELFSLKK